MATDTDSASAARLLGAKGGNASAAKLTPEQRKDRARKAVAARWAKWRAARDAEKGKASK